MQQLPASSSVSELTVFSLPPSWLPSCPPSVVFSSPRLLFVCIGDSITERGSQPCGFVSLLTHHYGRRADIMNRGYGGYNSDWIKHLIDRHQQQGIWVGTDRHQQISTLCLGANDAVFPPIQDNKQYVPIDRYISNLDNIIKQLTTDTTAHTTHVILISPPSVDPHAWSEFQQQRDGLDTLPPHNRSNSNTALYAQAVKEIAFKHKIPFVDLFTLTSVKDGENNPYLVDGLHLSVLGHALLFQHLVQTIKDEWPDLAADKLPMDAPVHAQLTPDNYKQRI